LRNLVIGKSSLSLGQTLFANFPITQLPNYKI